MPPAISMNKLLNYAGVASIAASLLVGCGGGKPGDSDNGPGTSPEPEMHLGAQTLVSYGPHAAQVADVYYPQGAELPVKGVVVWIHGGGWSVGDKADYAAMTSALTKHGLAVVNMNYRLNADGQYPKSVDDVQTVLGALATGGCATCEQESGVWKTLHAARDLPLFVGGSSAGGYLAMMGSMAHLAENPRGATCVFNQVGFPDLRILDTTSAMGRGFIQAYSGGDVSDERLGSMSPVVKLEAGEWDGVSRTTQFIMTYSENDQFVPYASTRRFTEVLQQKQFPVTEVFHSYPADGYHGMSIATAERDFYANVAKCFGIESLNRADQKPMGAPALENYRPFF